VCVSAASKACQQVSAASKACQQVSAASKATRAARAFKRTYYVCVFLVFFFLLRGALEAWSLFSVCVCVCARARVVQGVEGCELSGVVVALVLCVR